MSIVSLQDRASDLWLDIAGPRGWRTIAGPTAFAVVSIGLLVYDHLQQRVPHLVFWLALALIGTVYLWMLQCSRRLRDEHDHQALSDRVSGLDNRLRLETDIEAALRGAGDRRLLLLFDLEGLNDYNNRFGYAAGDELLRHNADQIARAAGALGGKAYRLEDGRLALLVPAGGGQRGEDAVIAAAALQGEGSDLLIGQAYGEALIPEEASDSDSALQIAGRRLSANRQLQHRSARRQAHSVLTAVLAARRPELREHLRFVLYRAIAIGRHFELTREEIDDIALAAELQDIGMLAVPDAILEKRTTLTPEEEALIRDRPVVGERIIASAPGLAPVAALVRACGEHFDGSGYPDGLAGEEIPLGARIVAVAVAFAALTAPQPYRGTGSIGEALAELRRCAGTQFDPLVVEVLAADLAEEGAELSPRSSGLAPDRFAQVS